ncbi:hypothetical protein J1614_005531 [Plenodomus biglobosus]|nr:hypothetical protein J1614_005531 [Plenodomus biglobosus]
MGPSTGVAAFVPMMTSSWYDLPYQGRWMDEDAKVAREVAIMYYVKSYTTIPVPTIHHWGLSKDNPLGLGAFIIIDFIAGMSLRDIVTDETDPDSKILRSDVPDEELRILPANRRLSLPTIPAGLPLYWCIIDRR